MRQTIRVGMALALLSLAGATWAQEDGGTAFDTNDESGGNGQQQQAQPQRQQPASGQGGGTRGVQSPGGQQGQASNITTEQYQDWTVRCGTPRNASGERCEMSQKVTRDSGEAVMRMVVGFTPQNGQPAAILQLPLGIVLPEGVALRVDDGEPVRFPVQICVEQGCRADLPLKSDLLQQMKAGRRAYVTVRTPRAEGGTAELPVSLLGFTAAFNRLSESR